MARSGLATYDTERDLLKATPGVWRSQDLNPGLQRSNSVCLPLLRGQEMRHSARVFNRRELIALLRDRIPS